MLHVFFSKAEPTETAGKRRRGGAGDGEEGRSGGEQETGAAERGQRGTARSPGARPHRRTPQLPAPGRA